MPTLTRHYIVEYRRLSDTDDFQFAGVIGELTDGSGLEYRHKEMYSPMAKRELSRNFTNLGEVARARFGPLVSRTTTISSREDLDTMFAQYLAVERHNRAGKRTRRTSVGR